MHTILLADDDRDDTELLKTALEDTMQEFVLYTATDGNDALTKLNELHTTDNLPCIIIIDINMPLLNGKELYNLISSDKRFSHIPVVILSSSVNKRDKDFFANQVPYFTKPYSFDTLSSIVTEIVSQCKEHAA